MIYFQYWCFCVDLRIGTMIIGVTEILINLIFGIFIAFFGESGDPDLCHKLFLIFMAVHMSSAICLLFGTLKLRPGCMLFYIIATLIKILAMIILFISDIILVIWWPVLFLYAIMFILGIYNWLTVYSFYAALGGSLFA